VATIAVGVAGRITLGAGLTKSLNVALPSWSLPSPSPQAANLPSFCIQLVTWKRFQYSGKPVSALTAGGGKARGRASWLVGPASSGRESLTADGCASPAISLSSGAS